MKDPLGSGDCKIGITGVDRAIDRLGVYQNSYSARSHYATFNHLWYGKSNPISKLESVLKDTFGYAIMLEGRGYSEWIAEPEDVILNKIAETIEDYHFHVYEIGQDINVHNINDVINRLTNEG
jgi:hypothetical protein|tara:strand:+ start:3492 stop:3860 length:369 start_codon:yes stop_codon:yes gene_type:complete